MNNINWLLDYVSNLNHQFRAVSSREKDDYSEDRIKIFFHRNRVSNFLRGHDEKVIPITFEMWPSLSCDARCPLCTFSLNHARKEADKSQELHLADTTDYKQIIDKLKNVGVNSIILTGGGEPLINPNIVEITSHIDKANLSWGMFTHGMLLNETVIRGLLSSSPRFIRISVNSGSPEGHEKEYRIGSHTYELVKNNAILAASISKKFKRSIGLGYAIDGKITSEDLLGIRRFISEVMDRSQGGLASVSFRPKVIYYSKYKTPLVQQPNANLLANLIDRIEELVVAPLREGYGCDLNVDFKKGMFQRLYNGAKPSSSIATGWTGSLDNKGRAYILSELNGSPWPNCELGNLRDLDFNEVWEGETRKRVVSKYSKGELLAPTHHKLSHIDETLKEIRENVGPMSQQEVDAFFSSLDQMAINKPKNWDFL